MSQDIVPLFSKGNLTKHKKSTLGIPIVKHANAMKDSPLKRATQSVQRVKSAPKPVKPAK